MKGPWYDAFARRLTEAITRAGYTPAQLAEKLHLTEASVSRWRSGQTTPKLHTLARLCKELAIPPGWLLGVSDDPPPPPLTRDEAKRAAAAVGVAAEERAMYTLEQIVRRKQ